MLEDDAPHHRRFHGSMGSLNYPRSPRGLHDSSDSFSHIPDFEPSENGDDSVDWAEEMFDIGLAVTEHIESVVQSAPTSPVTNTTNNKLSAQFVPASVLLSPMLSEEEHKAIYASDGEKQLDVRERRGRARELGLDMPSLSNLKYDHDEEEEDKDVLFTYSSVEELPGHQSAEKLDLGDDVENREVRKARRNQRREHSDSHPEADGKRKSRRRATSDTVQSNKKSAKSRPSAPKRTTSSSQKHRGRPERSVQRQHSSSGRVNDKRQSSSSRPRGLKRQPSSGKKGLSRQASSRRTDERRLSERSGRTEDRDSFASENNTEKSKRKSRNTRSSPRDESNDHRRSSSNMDRRRSRDGSREHRRSSSNMDRVRSRDTSREHRQSTASSTDRTSNHQKSKKKSHRSSSIKDTTEDDPRQTRKLIRTRSEKSSQRMFSSSQHDDDDDNKHSKTKSRRSSSVPPEARKQSYHSPRAKSSRQKKIIVNDGSTPLGQFVLKDRKRARRTTNNNNNGSLANNSVVSALTTDDDVDDDEDDKGDLLRLVGSKSQESILDQSRKGLVRALSAKFRSDPNLFLDDTSQSRDADVVDRLDPDVSYTAEGGIQLEASLSLSPRKSPNKSESTDNYLPSFLRGMKSLSFRSKLGDDGNKPAATLGEHFASNASQSQSSLDVKSLQSNRSGGGASSKSSSASSLPEYIRGEQSPRVVDKNTKPTGPAYIDDGTKHSYEGEGEREGLLDEILTETRKHRTEQGRVLESPRTETQRKKIEDEVKRRAQEVHSLMLTESPGSSKPKLVTPESERPRGSTNKTTTFSKTLSQKSLSARSMGGSSNSNHTKSPRLIGNTSSHSHGKSPRTPKTPKSGGSQGNNKKKKKHITNNSYHGEEGAKSRSSRSRFPDAPPFASASDHGPDHSLNVLIEDDDDDGPVKQPRSRVTRR